MASFNQTSADLSDALSQIYASPPSVSNIPLLHPTIPPKLQDKENISERMPRHPDFDNIRTHRDKMPASPLHDVSNHGPMTTNICNNAQPSKLGMECFPPSSQFGGPGGTGLGAGRLLPLHVWNPRLPAKGLGAMGLHGQQTQGPWNSLPDAQGWEATMEPRNMQPDAQGFGAARLHGMHSQGPQNSSFPLQGDWGMEPRDIQPQQSWESPPDAQGYGMHSQRPWNSSVPLQGYEAIGPQGMQPQQSWESPPDPQGYRDMRVHGMHSQRPRNSSVPLQGQGAIGLRGHRSRRVLTSLLLQGSGAMGQQDKQSQRPLTSFSAVPEFWPMYPRDMQHQQSGNSSFPFQGCGTVGSFTSSLPAQGQGVMGPRSMPPWSSLDTHHGLRDMGAQGTPPQGPWNSTAAGQETMPRSWSLPQQSSQAPSGVSGQAGSQLTVALAPSSHDGFGMHNTSRSGLNNLAKTQAPGIPHLSESSDLSLSSELYFSNPTTLSAVDPGFNPPGSMNPTPYLGPAAFNIDLESATSVTVSGSLASIPDVSGSSTPIFDTTNPTLPLPTTDEVMSEDVWQSILNQTEDDISTSLLDDMSDSPLKSDDMTDQDSPLLQPHSPTLPQATEASEPSAEQKTTDHEGKLPLSSEKKMDHGPCAQLTPGASSAVLLGENSQGLMQMRSKNQHSCGGEVGQEDGSSDEGRFLNAQQPLGPPAISMTRSGRISHPVDRSGIAPRTSCNAASSQYHPYPMPRQRRRKSPLKSREISYSQRCHEATPQSPDSFNSKKLVMKTRQNFTEVLQKTVEEQRTKKSA